VSVSLDYFVAELRKSYNAMESSVRSQKIRELVAESKEMETFIRERFPEFLAEAFPPSAAKPRGIRSVSTATAARSARNH
jgi:hypothetical protein